MLRTWFKNQKTEHQKTKIYTCSKNFQFHFHYRVMRQNIPIKTQKPQQCYSNRDSKENHGDWINGCHDCAWVYKLMDYLMVMSNLCVHKSGIEMSGNHTWLNNCNCCSCLSNGTITSFNVMCIYLLYLYMYHQLYVQSIIDFVLSTHQSVFSTPYMY